MEEADHLYAFSMLSPDIKGALLEGVVIRCHMRIAWGDRPSIVCKTSGSGEVGVLHAVR